MYARHSRSSRLNSKEEDAVSFNVEVTNSPALNIVSPNLDSLKNRKKAQEEELMEAMIRINSHRDSITSMGNDSEMCLICMNAFTENRPGILIPCSNRCNSSMVHERCIYEWKERQNGVGTCPLCRSALKPFEFVPPDMYKSATLSMFAARKDFVTRPLPPHFGMVRCYVKVSSISLSGVFTGYEVYLQAPSILPYPLGPLPRPDEPAQGDRLLMIARKKNGFFKSRIEMSLDIHGADFSREGKHYCGCVQSSFGGLEHVVTAPPHVVNLPPHGNSKAASSPSLDVEIAHVLYSQNRLGKGIGPRKMKIILPSISVDSRAPLLDLTKEADYDPKTMKRYLEDDDFDEDDDNYNNQSQQQQQPRDKKVQYVTNAKSPGAHAKTLSMSSVRKIKQDYVMKLKKKKQQANTDVIAFHTAYDADGGGKGEADNNTVDNNNNNSDMNSLFNSYIFGKNKEPYWLESICAYSLDFHGRVTLPSNKNFIMQVSVNNSFANSFPFIPESVFRESTQLPSGAHNNHGEDDNNPRVSEDASTSATQQTETICTCLLFGKTEEFDAEIYTMDVQHPMSILQAVGICLSSTDRKLLCA